MSIVKRLFSYASDHKSDELRRLYFSCNYGFKLDGVEKINTTFVFRLTTSEASAAGEKYFNYKTTPKFNATYLKSISLEE